MLKLNEQNITPFILSTYMIKCYTTGVYIYYKNFILKKIGYKKLCFYLCKQTKDFCAIYIVVLQCIKVLKRL